MVGLSIVLESSLKNNTNSNNSDNQNNKNNNLQVISKTTMIKPFPMSPKMRPRVTRVPGFLDQCFLCNMNVLPGKDIYMYKGDRAFCSVECRCNQIDMDDEVESHKRSSCSAFKKDKFSLGAIKGPKLSAQSSSSSSSRCNNGAKSRNAANGFVF